jgi:YHS domain-containing protein
MINGRMDWFRLYTVAETLAPIRASGGMRIVPDHALATAPEPKVIVIPAHSDPNNHPFCAVCGMDVDAVNGPKSVYKGKTYYFCSADHKDQFDAAPAKFLGASKL